MRLHLLRSLSLLLRTRHSLDITDRKYEAWSLRSRLALEGIDTCYGFVADRVFTLNQEMRNARAVWGTYSQLACVQSQSIQTRLTKQR
jgi:hypothetical protein